MQQSPSSQPYNCTDNQKGEKEQSLSQVDEQHREEPQQSINHDLQHVRRDDQTQARKEGQDEAELDNIYGRDNVIEERTKDVSLVRCDPKPQSKTYQREGAQSPANKGQL